MKITGSTALGVAVAMSLLGAHVQADPDREVKLEIGRQVLRDALIDWARQTGCQIILPSSEISNRFVTPSIDGALTPASALQRMLADTPLTFEWLDERTVAIREKSRHPSNTTISHFNGQPMVMQKASFVHQQRELGRDGQVEGAGDTARMKGTGENGDIKRDRIEEIIVTAQKRQERLEEVPISISVLTGAELDRATEDGITQVLRQVPGTTVNVTQQGGGTQLIVRGVSASGALANGSSPVSYYLDSVPFGLVRNAIAPDASAYDLERVEVLRGPQGTLYGANAQNGVVRVLTKDANPHEFELKARTSISTTEGGAESYRGDVALNVPIVQGKLGARVVLGYQDLGGWIDRPNKRDANDAQLENMRLKLNAQLTERLGMGLMAWRSRTDFGGPSTSNEAGRQAALLDEPIRTDFDAYALKIDYELEGLSMSSVTSYLEYTNDSLLDLNTINFPNALFQTYLDSEVFAQEINLSSSRSEAWRWTAGAMYRRGEDLRLTISHLNGIALPPSQDQSDESESFAAFGEVTRVLLDGQLELTAGLRYFEDHVKGAENSNAQGLVPLIRTDRKFDAVSPRAIVTWHPNEDLTIYASYAEGFRSGFDQGPAVKRSNPQFPAVDADTLKNYELGAKGSLNEGRVSFEAAVYFVDWQDVQQSLIVQINSMPFTANVNGESASGIGADLGLRARFSSGLEMGLSGSWNDLSLDAEVLSGGVVLFDEGERLNFSPEYTVGAFVDYVFPFDSAGLEGRVSLSANHVSEMDHRTIVGGARRVARGDAMWMSRASFSIASREHWVATVFMDNVNDERGSPVRYPFGPGIVTEWDTRIRPRTTGLQLEYRF